MIGPKSGSSSYVNPKVQTYSETLNVQVQAARIHNVVLVADIRLSQPCELPAALVSDKLTNIIHCRTQVGARGCPTSVPSHSELGNESEYKEGAKEECRTVETTSPQFGHDIYSQFSVTRLLT
jgi:hypothetical protein